MKVGDKVQSKSIPEKDATIISINIETTWDDLKKREVTKTRYVARYDNGTLINFYGFNIGKTIFKSNDSTQLSFFDYYIKLNKKEI